MREEPSRSSTAAVANKEQRTNSKSTAATASKKNKIKNEYMKKLLSTTRVVNVKCVL